MLLRLENILDAEQLSVVVQRLRQEKFVDGRLSAGDRARVAKVNKELSGHLTNVVPINNIVMGALLQHPVYRHGGLAHRIAAPIYSMYQVGMKYGRHIDDPIMGHPNYYRSDIAITIFLNSPEDYGGGELEIETEFGRQQVKEPAGNGVMYPASSCHQVCEVTEGERLVAITWMQSLVPEPERRRILYELYQAKERLIQQGADTQAIDKIEHSYVNLIRMWSHV